MVVVLDLGATWGALGVAAGTDDPQQIAGILRAILASVGDSCEKVRKIEAALAETRRKVQALRDVASGPEKD
jgi:hypothetical protein